MTIEEALALAKAHHQASQLSLAEPIYRQILQAQPNHAEALALLGVLTHQSGQPEQARAYMEQAIQSDPRQAFFHSNLGVVYQTLGRIGEAIACYRQALLLQPDNAEAHNNLGNILLHQGKLHEAVASYRQALDRRPDYADARNNLGNAFLQQGELEQAAACFRQALELRPDIAEVHNNLGSVFRKQGQLEPAAACFRQALRLRPDYIEALANLGGTLQLLGQLEEALACYRRILQLQPNHTNALAALVYQMQYACLWEDLEVLARRVVESVESDAAPAPFNRVPPFSFVILPATTAAQQLRCARRWVEHQLMPASSAGPRIHSSPHRPSCPKITLGYLSSDFHGHATAYLIAELIEKHDRGRFTVLGYSYGPDDGSPMRRRLAAAFDQFIDVKDASFEAAARRIAEDSVDILIDLKGYTSQARTEIVALRPAPIQVNYLGYPGTMGAPFIDYLVVDDFIVPPEQQPFFTEKLAYLPGCYQVNDSQRPIAERTPTRAECGLPEKGFVYCSFNDSYKITPAMFTVWMRLLRDTPGSVLWLLDANREAPGNLRREAEARGVSGEQLIFAPRQSLPEHLARHRLADLFLDTYPVNAHTTASDALWASCPLLTLAGETFISRVAGSLLRALDLPELVATSLEEYETRARELTRDTDGLRQLRACLEAKRLTSRLFDGAFFARNLEEALATMWAIHQAGEPPRSFALGPR